MSRYLYICSSRHSGSTLLDLLLGSHSRIETLGEITKLPKNIALNSECACGSAISECELWKPVIECIGKVDGVDYFKEPYKLTLGPFGVGDKKVFDSQHMTYLWRYKNYLSEVLRYVQLTYGFSLSNRLSRQYDEYINKNVELFEEVLSQTNKDHVVDSSKRYSKAIGFYKAQPKNTKILLLVRNGKAVFHSGIRRGWSLNRSISTWKNYYKRILPQIGRHVSPKDIIKIKYEDLVSNATSELMRLCEFIGCEYESTMLDYEKIVHHATSGNRNTFTQKRKIELTEHWRSELSSKQLSYFERKAGKLNKELGYD